MTHKKFAPETSKKITWVFNMYNQWREYRNNIPRLEDIFCDLKNLDMVTASDLCFAMTRFITEVRKIDGTQFPGKTIYEIVVCVQMFLETQGFNYKLIDGKDFTDLKYTLDNVMKQRTEEGVGIFTKQAKVLSLSDEDFLWCNGYLGTSNPQQLLNTVLFSIGLSCALRAGKEHRSLRGFGFNSQFSWHMDDQFRRFFRYKEDIGLKTNKGGLKHRKVSPKIVDVYPSPNHERCPVRILYTYFCKLPINHTCPAFYLRPVVNFTPNKWFQNAPVGVNKLQNVVKSVCAQAGLEGNYSNHSLRSAAATRMYHANCDEQLIQEITGHCSLAVRSYKRTCDEQKRMASECISGYY